MTDPLERLDEFKSLCAEPVFLPVASWVVETRPEMMGRIRRITEWHRRWFRFQEEIIVSSEDPGIPGTRFVNCGRVPANHAEAWYSEMCISGMGSMVSAPFVLVWQWDGFVVNPNLWTHEFLKWDYVGGPIIGPWWWKETARMLENKRTGWKCPFQENEVVVGGGGFSLRSSRFLRVSSFLKSGVYRNVEDFYLCVESRREMEEAGVRFCPIELAMKFSKDEDDRRSMGDCFGFHDASNMDEAKRLLESRFLTER